jgi:triphosphoribosyl-dephospho-CoA synthase
MNSDRLAQLIHVACLLEATARKPGNVHPQAAFDDLRYQDFVTAAEIVAPILAEAATLGVGRAVFEAVEATHSRLGKNVNLGIALLIAPLAAVPLDMPLNIGVGDVLRNLTRDDADKVYQAIQLVNPGGMGRVEAEDVSHAPSVTLLEAMRLAADRDTIALQYVVDFNLIFQSGANFLWRAASLQCPWEEAIVDLHLRLMADHPDTLIARKCGDEVAQLSSRKAQDVLDANWPDTEQSQTLMQDFDTWLRADGHRRNPGTTADLVAAALFAAFRDGDLPLPSLETILGENFNGDSA